MHFPVTFGHRNISDRSHRDPAFMRDQAFILFILIFTTARRCCGVYVILAPATKLHTYLLTYLLT